MQEPEDALVEEITDKNFDYWLNRPFVGAELRQELAKANVLIVPNESEQD
jgi:hypothetical protein